MATPTLAADGPRRRAAMSRRVAADPYQWLEDVTGDKALDLGQGSRTRRPRPNSASTPRVQAARSRHPRHPRFRRQDPRRREDRRLLLQLLEGQGPRARPVAPHDAGGIPQAAAAVGNGHRPRRAERKAEGEELGLARRRLPQARLQRCLVALSRGGADADVTREFDLTHQAVGQGRLLPPRGQGRAAAGSTRTPSTSSPTSAPAR